MVRNQLKVKSISLVLLLTLAMGVFGCKSHARKNAAPPQQASAEEVAPQSPQGNTEPQKEESVNAEPQPSATSGIKPLPVISSKGATRVEMRNVDFHSEDDFILHIRSLRGAFLRRSPFVPVVFDDKRSFVFRIDSSPKDTKPESVTISIIERTVRLLPADNVR